MSRNDLTGQVFGIMEAVSPTDKRFHRSVVWRCRCTACGAERDIPAMYLRSTNGPGPCQECGAGARIRGPKSFRTTWKRGPKKGCTMEKNIRDLTGQVFGELTVLKRTDRRSHGSVIWECECACKKICYVSSNSLKSGQAQSCGHLRSTSRRADITGQRSGRLVADHPIKNSPDYRGAMFWLCHCDCGSVRIVQNGNIMAQNITSCGCTRKMRNRGYMAECPSCKEKFEVTLDGSKTPQFCEKCTPKYRGRTWRVCPICRQLFPASPSDNKLTCSSECSRKWKSITHMGSTNQWSQESRQRLSARGQTENLKLGTTAAQQSPIAGRFESNENAKIWTLVDPSGKEFVVRNLLLWARENTELFGKPPGDKSANQIAAGFRAIATTLSGRRGTPGKSRGALTYFGWSLKGLPEEPPDN